MIVTMYSGDEFVSTEAYLAPKRDRINVEAAFHAHSRARDYAQRMVSHREPSVGFDKVQTFASVMDDFLIFCLFCRRYLELVPQNGLAGHSISVIEVPQDLPHFGFSLAGKQTNISVKTLVERVIHCVFHYPLYKTHPNGNDTIVAGCEVKSDRDQVYQISFTDIVDTFLNHTPSVLETQRAEYLAQDRIERDQMIAEHNQRGHA